MIQMSVYSKAIQERAMELVAKSDKWAEGVEISTGRRFVTFASSREPKPGEQPVYYRTSFDGRFCTCPAGRLSKSARCCHKLAAALVTERVQEAAATPRKTYEDLWQGTGFELTDAF